MSDCCDPVPYRRFFNTKEANRRLKKYRKRGIDSMATGIVDYLKTRDIAGSSVLEVGGGVGDVQVELLKSGAGTALNVELSDAYDSAAKGLAAEAGFESRMSQQFGDFVEMQGDIAPADIVVLNRVVCCYPHMERMMSAAVAKTERFLGLVYPRDRRPTRAFISLGNRWNSFRKCEFRAFVHPVEGIDAVATDAGLVERHRGQNVVWHNVVFERAA